VGRGGEWGEAVSEAKATFETLEAWKMARKLRTEMANTVTLNI